MTRHYLALLSNDNLPVISVDDDYHAVCVDGRKTILGNMEYAVFMALWCHRNHRLSVQEIANIVYGDAMPTWTRDTVRAHIYNLRQQLEVQPKHPKAIVSLRIGGYMLRCSPDAPSESARPSARSLPRLSFDQDRGTVTVYGHTVALTAKLYAVFKVLWEHRGHRLSMAEIADATYGDNKPKTFDAAVRQHIRKLRKMLELDPQHPQLLVSPRRMDYILQCRP